MLTGLAADQCTSVSASYGLPGPVVWAHCKKWCDAFMPEHQRCGPDWGLRMHAVQIAWWRFVNQHGGLPVRDEWPCSIPGLDSNVPAVDSDIRSSSAFRAALHRRAHWIGVTVDEMRERFDACFALAHAAKVAPDPFEVLYRDSNEMPQNPADIGRVAFAWLQLRKRGLVIEVTSADRLVWDTREWGDAEDRRCVRARPGVVLLWALALEIDEREATLTGELVCRLCSGRGYRIVLLDQGRFVDPAFVQACKRNGWRGFIQEDEKQLTRMVVRLCPCSDTSVIWSVKPFAPLIEPNRHVRPDTISLEWLVRKLAALGPFIADLSTWPETWQMQLNKALADGETHWIAQWWVAFAEWCAGKEPDAAQLARLLAMRLAELRERVSKRTQRWRIRSKEPARLIYTDNNGVEHELDSSEVDPQPMAPRALDDELQSLLRPGERFEFGHTESAFGPELRLKVYIEATRSFARIRAEVALNVLTLPSDPRLTILYTFRELLEEARSQRASLEKRYEHARR